MPKLNFLPSQRNAPVNPDTLDRLPPPPSPRSQLGIAGAFTVGLRVLQQALRGVVGRDVLGRATWLLGAGLIVFRLASGTLARWALMAHANARLRRELLQQLRTVDERIRIMVALRAWTAPAAGSAPSSPGPTVAAAATPEPRSPPAPQPQASSSAGSVARPGNSSESSSSMEILEHSAESPGSKTSARALSKAAPGQLSREALRKYAQLGRRRG